MLGGMGCRGQIFKNYVFPQAFASCSEKGLPANLVHGLLIALASLVAECGFWDLRASVVAAHGL